MSIQSLRNLVAGVPVLLAAALCTDVHAQTTRSLPANAFRITFTGSGAFSEDIHTTIAATGVSDTDHLDGKYTFKDTWNEVFIPLIDTSYASAMMQSPALSGIKGTWESNGTETESQQTGQFTCTGPISAHGMLRAPLSYRPVGGGTRLKLSVAPADQVATTTPGADCKQTNTDAFGNRWLNQFVQVTDYPREAGAQTPGQKLDGFVTIPQSELGEPAFKVAVKHTSKYSGVASGDAANCNEGDGQASSDCTWKESWKGTLTFTRVCAAHTGATVSYRYSLTDATRVKRYLPLGKCS